MSLSMGIGCFFLLNTVVKDICARINLVNDIAKLDGNRLQMIEQLSDYIGTHSVLLELSEMNLFHQLILLNLNAFFKTCLQTIRRIFQPDQTHGYGIFHMVLSRDMCFAATVSNGNSSVSFHMNQFS